MDNSSRRGQPEAPAPDAPLPVWLEAAACMAVAAMGFAIMNASAKAASRSVPFLEVAFVRCAVGALLVVTYARLRGVSLRVQNRKVMVLRAASGTASMLLTFYALSTAPLGEASALLNLTPLFVATIAVVWLREKVAPMVAVALVLGLVGALLVFRPTSGGGSGGVAAMGASMTSAFAMTSLRKLGSTETPEAVVFGFLATGSIVIGSLALPGLVMPSARDALLMLTAGVSSTIAQVAMTRAYALDVAARVGGMNYLNIVASLSLAVLLFGERPSGLAVVGIGAILGAGGLLVWTSRSPARVSSLFANDAPRGAISSLQKAGAPSWQGAGWRLFRCKGGRGSCLAGRHRAPIFHAKRVRVALPPRPPLHSPRPPTRSVHLGGGAPARRSMLDGCFQRVTEARTTRVAGPRCARDEP